MVAKNLLRGKIAEKGLTQRAVARTVGLSAQSFSYKMNGKKAFTATEISDISKVLALDKDTAWEIFLM